MRFHLLTVIDGPFRVASKSKARPVRTFWSCKCSCGKTKMIQDGGLMQGRIKSCGHLRTRYEDPTMCARNDLYYAYQVGARIRKLEFLISRKDFDKIIQLP
jgi:hypothetical protein